MQFVNTPKQQYKALYFNWKLKNTTKRYYINKKC